MKIGRPKTIKKETLQKLEEVFALGGSDKEACFYAGISPSTLYNYQTENLDFLERKELLKESPILLARRTVISEMKKNPHIALKYLERRKRDEFSLKFEIKEENDKKPIPILNVIRFENMKGDRAVK